MPILSHVVEKRLLGRVFEAVGPAPVRIVLPDGLSVSPPGITPVATVSVRDRATLAALVVDPEVAFGEAYADGRIQIEGDLVQFLEAVYDSISAAPAASGWYARLISQWMEWWQANSLHGSRDNIHRHYDLGNDFYKLWLDDQLVYTCAYFPTPAATLEEAQTAKMDHVSRKVRLQPGEKVVEAGCGWGALALYMARHYGVSVKAFNVSHEQIVYARERARREGLSGQVEFIEDDYRNIAGKFDVFLSVGMLEHVGVNHYRDLGEAIHRSIGHSGRGLLHFIGRNSSAGLSRWIRKRIFPGAYAPTLQEAMRVLEPHNYAVLDVENLRMHYARTLEHWLDRFDRSQQQVAAMFDARFLRMWRLYLAGSIAGFRRGTLQLFQIVFAGAQCPPVWWTRAPLYTDSKPDLEKMQWMHVMS